VRVIETQRPTAEQRRRFIALVERFAPAPGRHTAPWPGLRFYRAHGPSVPDPAVYAPSICIVAQGAKEARIGDHSFRYDPMQYLVIASHMPCRARILEATESTPYLSLSLDIGASDVRDLLIEMDGEAKSETMVRCDASPLLRVSPVDGRFLDAVIRFVAAVADPMDRRILARPALREIIYLALQRDQGNLLRLAVEGESTRVPAVARALRYMNSHLHDRFDVATLARSAGMSSSSLHHAFKQVTTLTPVQYLKRIRLDEARRLMMDEHCDAAEAAFRVGYASPSQFSRDFKRLFGLPPRQYAQSNTRMAAIAN
jgi:AraC-like DNA-binding protein